MQLLFKKSPVLQQPIWLISRAPNRQRRQGMPTKLKGRRAGERHRNRTGSAATSIQPRPNPLPTFRLDRRAAAEIHRDAQPDRLGRPGLGRRRRVVAVGLQAAQQGRGGKLRRRLGRRPTHAAGNILPARTVNFVNFGGPTPPRSSRSYIPAATSPTSCRTRG